MEPKSVPHFNIPVRASVERFPSGEVYRLQSADDSVAFTEEDYQRIAQICSEPLIYDILFRALFDGRPYSVQDAEKLTKIAQEGWRKGSKFIFFIRNPQNQIVASTDIKTNDVEAGEVGYWCSQKSPGIMTNAVSALIELARNAGYKSLFGLTKAENEKSQSVLTRAGFTKDSELEKMANITSNLQESFEPKV